ncbi:MAG: VCBS repeat-containing protein [Pseudomonadota bacterium]|nr:VCBS repeat-containing protein [Pseudomonadota bacterium]
MRLISLVLLAACSDYDLSKTTDRGGREEDSGSGGPDTAGDEEPYPEDTDPNVCEPREIAARAIAQNDECYSEGPTVGSFTPVVEWTKDRWSVDTSSNNVMMMPAVGSLTDDDGDGDADADDVPDIVLITYGSAGTLRVVSGDGGAEILNVTGQNLQGQGGVALGDIDNDGWTDIIAVTSNTVKAFDASGTLMWTSASISGLIYGTSDNPSISDMDGDGRPEIIVGAAILDASGRIVGRGEYGMGGVNNENVGTTSFAVDLDGDGEQEVVTGNAVYSRDGTALWYNRQDDGYPAVGNFDSDDDGEIVVSSGGRVRLQDSDGTVLCSNRIPGADSAYYGGPPTVADFDGDGDADFALAAGSRYSVFASDCSVTWQAVTQDGSSGNTGSSVFDFEGDGIAEAVYADETRLWSFAGPDGAVKLESTEHSNATWLEYPAIADVDADGQAEIVVANTASYSGGASFYGITVFGDADGSWRSGRRIWNQHAYHITNVDDDGGIPRNADRNWLSYNNFRSGDIGAGGVGYSGPDLVVEVEDVCIDECDEGRLTVWVTVGNAGFEDVSTDVNLKLIGVLDDGSEVLLDNLTVTDTVTAGTRLAAFQTVLDPVPETLASVYAKVDKGNDAPDDEVPECIEDNNEHAYNENLCP